MATAKKAGKQEEAEAKPSKQISLKVALIALLVTGALGGGVAWYFLSNQQNAAHEEAIAKPQPPKPPIFAALEPFIVNLQPEMGEQYLQIAMTLQVADQLQADQVKLYMPLIRSRLLVLLSSKRPSELTSPDGKTKLAEEIIKVLNEPFSAGSAQVEVTSVFFTAFVIQ